MDSELQEKIQSVFYAIAQTRTKNGEPQERTQSRQGGTSYELERHGIFKRFQNVTFEAIEEKGLPPDKQIRANYAQVKKFASNLDEHIKNGEGLILSGKYGTMKTTMAVAVLRQLIDAGHGGLMIPMCSLIDSLYTLRTTNREEWARYEQSIRNTRLLVIDDLGGENTDQSWVLSKVDSIITERYNRMKSVIITTNKTPQELAGTYSGRIVDRLRSTSQVLTFDGKSQRGAGEKL